MARAALRRSAPWMVAAAMALSACGSSSEDRAVSGAGIGAGAGAVVGAVTGLSVVEGAAIGAAGGALTGVFTDESQVDMGDPVWKQGSGESGGAQTAKATTGTVTRIQSGLNALGYAAGPVDGIAGAKTREAIRRYQQDHGLLVDGEPTEALARHIEDQSQGG